MNKDDLLKHIIETAYNVGFGAKKHFATYDIVAKAPGIISFISLAFGIYALIIDSLDTKVFSATLIVLGVVGLYISFYDSKKTEYADKGQQLTDLFNALKRLYGVVKASESTSQAHLDELERIEQAYTKVSSFQQIMFSNWYAHYKFFWEQQIGWLEEQKNFCFLRDKVPLSLSFFVVTILLLAVTWSQDLLQYVCTVPAP
jgi:hypothetical protein